MAKPQLNLLSLQQVPIFEQLQLEEALLRTTEANWCLINHGTPPAIVMGISGDLESLVHLEHWEKRRIPIIRRFSGGGTVVVDEETLLITLICSHSAIDILPFPEQILRWNAQLYAHALRDHPFAVRENDYVLGERKFGGNAQYLAKGRWLHHTSLLWKYQPEQMKLLKIPKKAPHYRQSRNHRDFLCCLADHIENKSQFLIDVKMQLAKTFELSETALETARQHLAKSHRQSTHLCNSNPS